MRLSLAETGQKNPVLTKNFYFMQTKLEQTTENLLDIAIDQVFCQLHENFFTKSGDITPDQQFMLSYYQEQIAKICVQVIKQNQ